MPPTINPAGHATGGGGTVPDLTSDPPENNDCHRDPQVIRVELSERRRVSGDRFAVAACSIAEVEGTAAPICGLARELLRLGIDPNTSLSIWREEVRCFVDATVGRWAELTVKEGSSGTVFRPYMPFSAWDAPSQARESDD